jgi:hypothetical protein
MCSRSKFFMGPHGPIKMRKFGLDDGRFYFFDGRPPPEFGYPPYPGPPDFFPPPPHGMPFHPPGAYPAKSYKLVCIYLCRKNCAGRARWYNFKNIFAEKNCEKIGVFDSKQS